MHCSRPPHEPCVGLELYRQAEIHSPVWVLSGGGLAPGRGMIQVQALMTGIRWMMLPPHCPLLGTEDHSRRAREISFFKYRIPNIPAFTAIATQNCCFSSQKTWVFLLRREGQKIKVALWDFFKCLFRAFISGLSHLLPFTFIIIIFTTAGSRA